MDAAAQPCAPSRSRPPAPQYQAPTLTDELASAPDGRTPEAAPAEGTPHAIALRLSERDEDLHPINVTPSQLAAVARAARETGTSRKLLLATLWQEQQWYQHVDGSPDGPASFVGRRLNRLFAGTVKPDKSLGITHLKPGTARRVLERHPPAFTAEDGSPLSGMSDAQLAAYIEGKPNEAIRLSAYHLADLRTRNPYGARTDKDLFLLYAADTPDVRERNERYGDASEHRGGEIRARGENWDRISPALDDAMAWEALGEAERLTAVAQLAAEAPPVVPLYGTAGAGPEGARPQ